MKREVISIVFAIIFGLSMVSACNLNISLINQDPYPANPGDYVKLLFQVTGVENPECGKIAIELVEAYPISFDPGAQRKFEIRGGTYARDFSNHWMIPFKVRTDENTMDGDNKVELALTFNDVAFPRTLRPFYISVNNSEADFEIHVDKYSYSTQELTLEVLNIAKNDVEALTLEIPRQQNIQIRGSNRAILGDLDSNEFTTADFKAVISNGDINIKILYTDQKGIRRETVKTVPFDASYFQPAGGEKKQNLGVYLAIAVAVILLLVILLILKSRKNKRESILRRGNARL